MIAMKSGGASGGRWSLRSMSLLSRSQLYSQRWKSLHVAGVSWGRRMTPVQDSRKPRVRHALKYFE